MQARIWTATIVVTASLGLAIAFATVAESTADAQIKHIAAQSDCARYQWKERGQGKPGYFKGIALEYSKASCALKRDPESLAATIATGSFDTRNDALAWYGKAGGIAQDRLRATYTLAIGEGMRESGGNPSEGFDTTVPPRARTADTAEAGLFQQSYDSIGYSPWLKRLFAYYSRNTSACRLDVFMEGYADKKLTVAGNGEGARFQALTKSCPAFALDYAALLFRVNGKHFGPLLRKEAEYQPACEAMLARIETIALANCSTAH